MQAQHTLDGFDAGKQHKGCRFHLSPGYGFYNLVSPAFKPERQVEIRRHMVMHRDVHIIGERVHTDPALSVIEQNKTMAEAGLEKFQPWQIGLAAKNNPGLFVLMIYIIVESSCISIKKKWIHKCPCQNYFIFTVFIYIPFTLSSM